jgi:Zn-dependent peptidase ImmA (M78 family)
MRRTPFNQRIDARALEVLAETRMLRMPVPVERVALALDLFLEEIELGDDVSGVLVVENGVGTIGYNRAQSRVRQRFTIAHEIGHFVLHRDSSQLFIDKHYTAVYRRNRRGDDEPDIREVEANRFAAGLLMPESLVLSEIEDLDFDLGDQDDLALLAERFQVSVQALSLRLGHLGVFPTDLE